MPTTATSPGVQDVDAGTVKSWLDTGQAVLVDVREPDEHARERIPGALLTPLSRFDPGALPHDEGVRVVFHCRTGRRSKDAAARATNAGLAGAFNLKGGIVAWKAAGFPVQENRKVPISLLRQVQLTIGVIILIGCALAWQVSPWFLIVPAFIGAGQVFAGASGTCGLAAALSLAPWNRAARHEAHGH